MHIEHAILIQCPPSNVFALVSDSSQYEGFFVGISRWEPRSRKRRGVGARFRVLMKVGAIEAGGILRVTEWDEPRRIAWQSESGIDYRGAWMVREAMSGTELRYEIDYSLPGPFGWLAERLTGRILDGNARATLMAARRILEHESHGTAPPVKRPVSGVPASAWSRARSKPSPRRRARVSAKR